MLQLDLMLEGSCGSYGGRLTLGKASVWRLRHKALANQKLSVCVGHTMAPMPFDHTNRDNFVPLLEASEGLGEQGSCNG